MSTPEIAEDPKQMEARILRRVAEALRSAYTPGYYGHGGPQDGDDEPPSFNARNAAAELEQAAEGLDQK